MTVDELAERFLVDKSTVRTAIRLLLSEGKLRRVVKNGKRYIQRKPEGHRPRSLPVGERQILFRVRHLETEREREFD